MIVLLENMYQIYLNENEILSPIAENIVNLIELETLKLDDNNIIESIPSDMGNLNLLDRLNMHRKYLTYLSFNIWGGERI